MKTLLPLICTIFLLSSCEKEEESTEINWETYSIRNEKSSDLRIAGGTGAQAHFFEIKQGDEGAPSKLVLSITKACTIPTRIATLSSTTGMKTKPSL